MFFLTPSLPMGLSRTVSLKCVPFRKKLTILSPRLVKMNVFVLSHSLVYCSSISCNKSIAVILISLMTIAVHKHALPTLLMGLVQLNTL